MMKKVVNEVEEFRNKIGKANIAPEDAVKKVLVQNYYENLYLSFILRYIL
jgi:hypothetical protein